MFGNYDGFGNFQNHKKLESGANFEGFGASREPLDLPSRAACWVLWVGFSTWCEALSSGGVFGQNFGSKHESSQICMRALEFYISNLVESESINDFLIHQRLGVAKIRISAETSRLLKHFVDFHEESERTGARRFVIRNHRVRIYILAFSLFPEPLGVHVTGGWCPPILVVILEFPKSRKTLICG